jgi:hypothetical protein
MAVINDPNTAANIAQVGDVSTATAGKALHVSTRPINYGSNGHYYVSNVHAIPVSASASGHRFALRNTSATKLIVITFVRIFDLQLAAATATIYQGWQLFRANSFTTSHTTNATAFTLTGQNQKKRASMATVTAAGFVAHSAAVAAGMTGQAWTLDSHPLLELGTIQTITTPNTTLWSVERDFSVGDGGHPVVLAQNEGIGITGPTIVSGAAGTSQLGYTIAWAEVDAY